jgi:16S rRNA (cytosine1402-N4)-methyltransferase
MDKKVTEASSDAAVSGPPPRPPRRPRYAGRYPKRFEEKYKEHDPEKYRDTVAKVLASGKTPAGSHRPIMVAEVLEVLAPRPGDVGVDCTLGYGGHAQELLPRLLPGGHLIGIDADPLELPKTESRLRNLGFNPAAFTACRSNFAGLPQILSASGFEAAHLVLADLGVSSMQLDDPARGFSTKAAGPLDCRMNPNRGQPASVLLARIRPEALAALLTDYADEPHSRLLAQGLAGGHFPSTPDLTSKVRALLGHLKPDEQDLSIRRTFQALRIAVNEELTALEQFLRVLPSCLKPAGRVAILTFHSGEDRRVKKAFEAGLVSGVYEAIAPKVLRPSAAERFANPRSASAKLRWARKA